MRSSSSGYHGAMHEDTVIGVEDQEGAEEETISLVGEDLTRRQRHKTDKRLFYTATALIFIPGVLFIVFVGPALSQRFSVLPYLFFIYVFIGDLVWLLSTHRMDPGFLPKQSAEDAEIPPPKTDRDRFYDKDPDRKEITVNGSMVKLRWCATCLIWRPPRASHCSDCDACVENFDHHCPWVGNCVGKRNYRTFLLFVYTTTFLCIYTMLCCAGTLFLLAKDSDSKGADIMYDVLLSSPISMFLFIYSFVIFWSVAGLSCFHSYLVCTGRSTHEEITARRNPYYKNPISNCKVICFPASMPSYVNDNQACLV